MNHLLDRPDPYIALDVNITYKCNLGCNNCDRLCYMNFDLPDIPIEQVMRLDRELPQHITKLQIVGGEPTLNPDLERIIRILKKPHRTLIVFTNGSMPFFSDDAHVYVSKKAIKTQSEFEAQQNAPVDEYGDVFDWAAPGCWIADYCGPGVDYEGYFPCGCSAMISKIFKLDIAVPYLGLLTETKIRQQRAQVCKYCGYYRRYVLKKPGRYPQQVTSRSWVEALANFTRK